MNTLIVLAVAIAAVAAYPRPGQEVSVTQDTLGNYNLKYAIAGISRAENRDINGNIAGGYSYIDPQGIERKIEFTSGAHGFQAIGADIPLPVQDTPEVAHAKAAHLTILRAAGVAAPPHAIAVAPAPLFEIPAAKAIQFAVVQPIVPVAVPALAGAIPETPEVIAAKAEHFAAHAAARASLG